jgi:hypothetical protein
MDRADLGANVHVRKSVGDVLSRLLVETTPSVPDADDGARDNDQRCHGGESNKDPFPH